MLRIILLSILILTTPAWAREALRAEKGAIDISSWNFQNGPVLLRGEWQFHWQKLYSEQDILAETFLQNPGIPIINPSGAWSELGHGITNHGFATYILRLSGLNGYAGLFSLSFSQFSGAHKSWLYIPSQKKLIPLPEVGVVTSDPATSIPQMRKVIAPLPEMDGSDAYLIVGTSVFVMTGGFADTPVLDWSARLQAGDQRQMWEAWFVLGMFCLLVVTNVSLFLLRHEDKPSLLMAGFSLVMGIRYFSTESMLPRFNPEATIPLFRLTVYPNAMSFPIGLAFYFHFFYLAFPGYFPRRGVQLAWSVALTYLAFSFIEPTLVGPLYQYFMLPFLGLIVLMLFRLIQAALRRVRGASLAFLGIAVLVAVMTNDVLVYTMQLGGLYLGHYGMVAFIVCQSLVVGSNFAFAFRTADKLSKDLQKEVERQTRDVKAILRNIHQGIFTVHAPGLRVGDDYSAFLEHILETKQIKDRDALDLIFANSSLSSDQKNIVKTILDGSINETALNFELNADNLVREMQLTTPGGHHKDILLDWQPVINEKSDIVEKMLVTLRDVTELKAMEQLNREQRRDIELITEIIEINPEKFDIFMKSGRRFIAENQRLISGVESPDTEMLKILFINMHTIKGAARTYRFKSMTALVHDCEQYYAQVQKHECSWSKADALAQLGQVELVFAEYDKVNRQKLKRNENLDVVKIDLETVRENIKYLQEIEDFHLDDRMTPFVDYVRKTFYHLYFLEVEKLFEDIFKSLPTLAKDLKKPSPKVHFKSVPAGISNEGCELLRNIFVHILRNTMDHGIEDAETRLARGKSPEGTIRIDISVGAKGVLTILYADDGGGLKLERIRESATRRGLVTGAESQPQKIAELIFTSGLSTSKSLNDISGRGVGMSAVREYVQKVGGEVFIHLRGSSSEIKDTEFEFEIRLPSELYTIFKEEKKVA